MVGPVVRRVSSAAVRPPAGRGSQVTEVSSGQLPVLSDSESHVPFCFEGGCVVCARFADMGLVDAPHTSMDVPSCRRLYKMRV